MFIVYVIGVHTNRYALLIYALLVLSGSCFIVVCVPVQVPAIDAASRVHSVQFARTTRYHLGIFVLLSQSNYFILYAF